MLTPRPPARPRTSITSTTSLPAAPPAGPKGATKVGIATHAFTAEQSADFKEVFTEADTDGSGSIDRFVCCSHRKAHQAACSGLVVIECVRTATAPRATHRHPGLPIVGMSYVPS